MVNEQTKIQIDRLKFYLNDEEINNELLLKDINLFEIKFSIKISKLNNDILNLKYPNSEIKQIKIDLYNTGLELLEEIQNQIITDRPWYGLWFDL